MQDVRAAHLGECLALLDAEAVLVDDRDSEVVDNRITIDGSTDLSRNEDVLARYAAGGWHTLECDGLDAGKVRARSTKRSPTSGRP